VVDCKYSLSLFCNLFIYLFIYGYALCDISTEMTALVMKVHLPDPVVAHLLSLLSRIEFRLSHGASEKIQLGALVGAFVTARGMMAPVK